MSSIVNGMKYLEHNELYLAAIKKYLTIVFVEDVSTGMKKEYAEFLDGYATAEEIKQIMRNGFPPYSIRDWLNGNLGLK